jgi:hypothetical protein
MFCCCRCCESRTDAIRNVANLPKQGRVGNSVDLGVVPVLRETHKALFVGFSQIIFSESDVSGGGGPLVVRRRWATTAGVLR